MKISDFKGKHPGGLLCPICGERFTKGKGKPERWACSNHKDTTIKFYMDEKNEFIRDIELVFKHTRYFSLWFDLKLCSTTFMNGSNIEDFNYILDLEVCDYTVEEILKIMVWA